MKPGDLIIWEEECATGGIVMGLVVERDYSDDSEPAVLVQFIEPRGIHLQVQKLHYYDREIKEWADEGTVRIQSAT